MQDGLCGTVKVLLPLAAWVQKLRSPYVGDLNLSVELLFPSSIYGNPFISSTGTKQTLLFRECVGSGIAGCERWIHTWGGRRPGNSLTHHSLQCGPKKNAAAGKIDLFEPCQNFKPVEICVRTYKHATTRYVPRIIDHIYLWSLLGDKLARHRSISASAARRTMQLHGSIWTDEYMDQRIASRFQLSRVSRCSDHCSTNKYNRGLDQTKHSGDWGIMHVDCSMDC
jgi:hypothetical protein